MKAIRIPQAHRRFVTLLGSVVVVLVLAGCTSFTEKSKPYTQQNQSTLRDGKQRNQEEGNLFDAPNQEYDFETVSLEGVGAKAALVDMDLTLLDMLTYAVQDEYLALGEYVSIMEVYGVQAPYSNISEAERSHLAMLQTLYQTYSLTFPTDPYPIDSLPPSNLLAAARLGVEAEIDNIAMYERFLSYNLPEDVATVFEILLKGSNQHLKAFEQQTKRLSK